MRRVILSEMNFRHPKGGWDWPKPDDAGLTVSKAGCLAEPKLSKAVTISGPGVHTRNGDTIELDFRPLADRRGSICLSFTGGMERLGVKLDLATDKLTIRTTEWNRRQPVAATKVKPLGRTMHTLAVEKADGSGRLVKNADVRVLLDGQVVLSARSINVLPEMGVGVEVEGARVLLRRFVHRGVPSGVPEYFHAGGWQMPNVPDVEANLASLGRGLRAAAEQQVRLLVTPETSLTGLFPNDSVMNSPRRVAAAARTLRRLIRRTANAPYLVVGLPVWQADPGQKAKTRYNVSRVYDPEGQVLFAGAKMHSCEPGLWHGCRLNEFEIDGAPISMYICHDGRYPEAWTLPVMFGARLVIHPCNSGTFCGSVEAVESHAATSTATSHAFNLRVNGGGESWLAGPQKYNNVIAVSDECRRDNRAFPMAGEPAECLLHANIRLHDAFGYWPIRSFRASEQVAEAYTRLYCALGGKSAPSLP